MFQDLGSSPATQEASRAADFVGCKPGNDIQQADAEQAYVQAILKGTETWVQPPSEFWPPEWFNADGSCKYHRPVVRLLRALYGHPDSGSYWEEHCNAHCVSVGFVPIPDWPSCFDYPDLDVLLVIYVDDIKVAGPKDKLPEVWKLLRQGLRIGPEGLAGHFLGCTHEKGEFTLANGAHVTSMTYNMESFLRSSMDVYLSLARSRGFAANLRDVPTPFIGEDHSGSPQGAPCGDDPTLYCPHCRHAFP